MKKRALLKGLLSAALVLSAFTGYTQQEGRMPLLAEGLPKSPVLRASSAAEKVIGRGLANNSTAKAPGGDVLVNNNNNAIASGNFTQSETSILAFGNNVVIGYNDAGSRAVGSHLTGWSYSTDAGSTFTDGGELPASAISDGGDPVLARNSTTGRIYYATLGSGSPNTIQVWRSDNNAVSWLPPVNATPGGLSEDKQWIVVDNFAGAGNGNVYVLSRRFAGAQGIYFFRSADHGTTFGPNGGTSIVAPVGGANVQGAFITVSPDHSISAFYLDDGADDIRVRRSTDFGATWSAPVIVVSGLPSAVINGGLGLTGIRQGTAVPEGFRSNSFPHAAANPVTGHLYMTYNNDPPGADRADVFYVVSTNNGATWSAPVRVNDDATTTDQWQPTLVVSNDGQNIGFFYYSRQEDPAGNNLLKYYGRIGSIAGGSITLGPGFAVSDVATLPEFGRDAVLNATYMGDYNQAVATDNQFHIVWSDARDDLAAGNVRKDPNVYYDNIFITVIDNADPVISCPANITTGNTAGACNKSGLAIGMAAATDNSGSVAITPVRSDGKLLSAPYPVGTTTIVWTATDPTGNDATCTQTIIINDTELPDAKCKNMTVTLVGGSATITAAHVNDGSTDNCGVASVSVSKTAFTCANIGSNTVTLTVTDVHGNTNRCEATVTVAGTAPTCNITSVPENNTYTGGVATSIYLGYGPQSTTLQVAAPASGAPYTYAWSGGTLSNHHSANPVFSPTTAGSYTFTAIITNKYGCTATCSITLHVYNIVVPGSKGKKVYLCHVPNGNPANRHTLEVSVKAVPAHLENHDGDRLGQCGMSIAPSARFLNGTAPEEPVARNAKLYPNPNRGSFELQLSNYSIGKLEIRIVNRTGAVIQNRQVVYTGKSQILKFNLESTTPGLYYIQIISNDGTESLKLVLER
jgi:hypothetical protein